MMYRRPANAAPCGHGFGARRPLGLAHAMPTRKVIVGFAPIEPGIRRVPALEWIAEAFTMQGAVRNRPGGGPGRKRNLCGAPWQACCSVRRF